MSGNKMSLGLIFIIVLTIIVSTAIQKGVIGVCEFDEF